MWSWPRIKRQRVLLDDQTSVSWQHLSLRPTQLGIHLLLIAAAIWLAALNYAINLAYGLAFWIVSIAIMATLLSIRQLLGLRLHIELPSEVFAGDDALIGIAVDGQDVRSRAFIVRFIDEGMAHKGLSKDDLNTVHTHEQGARSTQLTLATHHRGYEELPYLQLIGTAPFGLVEVSVLCACHEHFIVYPAPHPHQAHINARPVAENEGQIRHMGGDEVAYLKPYQQGWSLQTIAWKQFAKTNELLAKHFEQPMTARPDVISYKDYPHIKSSDQLAAMLCYRVLQHSDEQRHYVLELPNQLIAPQPQQRQLCLNALAVLP